MPYVPSKAPPTTTEDGAALASYLEIELERLASSIVDDVQAVEVRPAHAAPLRPRTGMIVYADGTDWNPGAGEGLYYYHSSGQWLRSVILNAGGDPQGVELGTPSVVATPYIDFHSSGNAVDWDARIIATGGTGSVGQANLALNARFIDLTYTDAGVGANLSLLGPGATTPSKSIRAMGGNLEFVNAAYSAVIATLTDAGDLSWTGSAWTDYTPTLTANAGSFTTASAAGRYKVFGKLVCIEIDITITTVGTGSHPIVTLPVTAQNINHVLLHGTETALTGKTINARANGVAQVLTAFYDNGNPAANGNVIRISGVYEAA